MSNRPPDNAERTAGRRVQKRRQRKLFLPASPPVKHARRRAIPKWVFVVGLSLCGCVFIFSAVKLVGIVAQYAQSRLEYSGIKQYGPTLATRGPENSAAAQAAPSATAAPQSTQEALDDGYDQEEEYNVDFETLRQINADTVAWLVVEGTNISYPVVQGKDNERYIHYTFEGRRNDAGCLFLDYRAAADFSSYNSTIYGHNQNDGSMFHNLENFKKEDFFKENRYITLYTPQKKYRLEIFSAYVSTGFLFNEPSFADRNTYASFLAKVVGKSRYKTDVAMTADYRMLTLSTCSYEREDARFVIHARFVD